MMLFLQKAKLKIMHRWKVPEKEFVKEEAEDESEE